MRTPSKRHRFVRYILLSLLLSQSVVGAAVPFDADADFMFATGLFRKQRWQYAADAFEKFLEANPEHPRAGLATLYFGLSLNSLEKYEPAREQFEAFVENNPNSRNLADAKYRIGECSFYLKEYQVAIPQLKSYLENHKGHNLNSWATLMLGESNNGLRQWTDAESILRQLVNSGPASNIVADSKFALAVSLHGQKKYPEAQELFQTVVDMKSATFSHRALARIGTINFERGQFAEASAAYDSLVTNYGDESIVPAALLQSGIAQFRLTRYPEAITRFSRIPADNELAAHASMWKGLCRRELGELDEARTELAEAFNTAGDTPLAAEILFNRAQLEVLDGKKDIAAQMFIDLTSRWKADPHVADSLFNATELKMETGDLPTARRLFEQFRTDFPAEAKRPRAGLLEGRILLNEGMTVEAIDVLKKIQTDSLPPRQQLLRGYHLIRALHRGKKFAEALAAYEPYHDQFSDQNSKEFSGAIALAAMSALEIQQYAKAREFADSFLKSDQDPRQTADALAARAVASGHLHEFDVAEKDLNRLIADYAQNPQTWVAVLQCAEAAWQEEEFAESAKLFGLASERSEDPDLHLSSLSGAAWSRYQLGEFETAATLFHSAHEKYPDSDSAIELRYMEAASLLEQDNNTDALKLFAAVYQSLASRVEKEPSIFDNEYFLDSGRMRARIFGDSGDVEKADQAWEELSLQFDKSELLDEILDEWAYLNLQNERYERSDEIYATLIDRFPMSRFAGQARLSLAESEMQSNRLDVALREFTEISQNEAYGEKEREIALYHAIDINAAQRDWPEVVKLAEVFAENHSSSKLAANVQLLYAEGLLDQRQLEEANEKLMSLRELILDGQLAADPWTERIWVALAEVSLARQNYSQVDQIAAELKSRNAESRFLFQMHDVQGRRWKTQAEPDFEKSREYFRMVTDSEVGRGTETAARCQFLYAETLLLEGNHKAALPEYFRVYLSYAYDDWRVRGLFQAAGCEAALNNVDKAKRSYNDLIVEFPTSDLVEKAKQKLAELTTAASEK